MYYQLTLQFGPSDIDKIKKILDVANGEDVKELKAQEKDLGIKFDAETFPWEEETTQEEEPCDQVPPEVVKKLEAKKKEEAKLSREEMVTACRSFQKAKGKETLRTLLGQFNAKKLDEVNPSEWPQLYEALNA